MNIEKLNKDIINEADKILYDMNLLKELSKFGEVFITGSYFLELMTWRDLDIYIKNDSIDEEKFCELGGKISSILKPHKMNYRDETLLKRGKPNGLYWGIYANIFGNKSWKLDIFVVDTKTFNILIDQSKKLKKRITKDMRQPILEIKQNLCSNPLYRSEVYSMDIYDSVIDYGICSTEEFSKWIVDRKGIEL